MAHQHMTRESHNKKLESDKKASHNDMRASKMTGEHPNQRQAHYEIKVAEGHILLQIFVPDVKTRRLQIHMNFLKRIGPRTAETSKFLQL